MYSIDLTYIKPLTEIEPLIEAHNIFLEKYYSTKNFIYSGRKNPREGGIILAIFPSLNEVNETIKDDPFYKKGIAHYSITEFIPTMNNKDLMKID